MSSWGTVTLAYHLASRLAYVVWVGWALRREWRTGCQVRRYGAEAAFRRFRRVGATLMNNDGVSFVVLCLVTRGTLPSAAPTWALLTLGAVLGGVGIGAKLWARAAIGADRYYWGDFFAPSTTPLEPARGPYGYLRDPMYTVGNLQLWGLPIAVASLPGLVAALFDHTAILIFNRVVEQPHVRERLASRPAVGSPDP